MSIISEVKCRRCDRKYPSIRSRCPYCGARRNKQGKHANDDSNSRAKLIIGGLLMALLIIAVIVLIVTSSNSGAPTDNTPPSGGTTSQSPPTSPEDPTGSGQTTTDNSESPPTDTGTSPPDTTPPTSESPPTTDTPTTNSPSPTGAVQAVYIKSYSTTKEDITMTVDEVAQLTYSTEPADAPGTPIWTSSNTNVFVVTQDGTVTAVGSGNATLTLEIDGAKAECLIRVP